ncbi:hypothetical protein pb186bvf_020734 [Paramecium bursaria]
MQIYQRQLQFSAPQYFKINQQMEPFKKDENCILKIPKKQLQTKFQHKEVYIYYKAGLDKCCKCLNIFYYQRNQITGISLKKIIIQNSGVVSDTDITIMIRKKNLIIGDKSSLNI